MFHFEFISTDGTETDYRVYVKGTKKNFRVRLRNNVLRGYEPLTKELLDAFNAWRKANFDRDLKFMLDHPEKYSPEFIEFNPPTEATL